MSSRYIYIKNIIQSPNAVTTEEGELVYKAISENFEKNINVTIDFEDIQLIISTFLNASIGQLYGKYEVSFIQQHLDVKNMSTDDLFVLKLVVDRAKEYFKDKNLFEKNNKSFPDAN